MAQLMSTPFFQKNFLLSRNDADQKSRIPRETRQSREGGFFFSEFVRLLVCGRPHPKPVICDAIHTQPEFTGCAQ